jgi:hypothetical protein
MTNAELAISALEDCFNECPDCDHPTAELIRDYIERHAVAWERVHYLLQRGTRLHRALADLIELNPSLTGNELAYDGKAFVAARPSAEAGYEDVSFLYDTYCNAFDAVHRILTNARANTHP